MAVRQEVNNFEISIVVQELEFAMNLALYGLLWSLGNQYIVESLSWPSLTPTANLLGISYEWLYINYRLLIYGCLFVTFVPLSSCFKVLM